MLVILYNIYIYFILYINLLEIFICESFYCIKLDSTVFMTMVLKNCYYGFLNFSYSKFFKKFLLWFFLIFHIAQFLKNSYYGFLKIFLI